MDGISNCNTNKFVYLVVHLIKFLTKINNFVKKNVAYKKKRKRKNPYTISIIELI